MKPKLLHAFRRDAFAPLFLITCTFSSLQADAQWLGAGAGGLGTNVNDGANWTGGLVNGDFGSINAAGATQLTLSADQTFANGTTVTKALVTSFASGATTFEVADGAGIEPGARIAGTGLGTGTWVQSIAVNPETNVATITTSIATTGAGAIPGNYTFTRPAIDFAFGANATSSATTVADVDLQIGSDVPGTQRVIRASGNVLLGQRTFPVNLVTTSEDVKWVLNGGALAWGRLGGDLTNPTTPLIATMVINGPVDLGTFSFANSRLVLEGGNLILNGKISGGGVGAGASLNFGSSSNAGTMTLTNVANDFTGVVSTNGFGTLTVTAELAMANVGVPSALGAGNAVTINNRSVNVGGFTTTQTTDKAWSVGGASGRLNNNGQAPVILTGAVRNNTSSTGSVNLGGTYLDRVNPNRIEGLISNGSQANGSGITVVGSIWQPTNAANSFTRAAGVSGTGSTLRVAELANGGVASTLGAGTAINLGAPAAGGAVNYFEFVGAQDASTDRTVSLTGPASSSNVNAIASNGDGTLIFTGPLTSAITTTSSSSSFANGTRTLQFDGIGDGVITGAPDLADIVNLNTAVPPVAYTAKVALAKRGSGTWTLSSTGFNHTGTTSLHGGHLILNNSINDQLTADPLASAGVLLNGGTLTLRGKSSGVTTEAWSTLTLGDASSSNASFNSSLLKLDSNGGAGIDLSLASLAAAGSVIRTDLIDLSENGNHVLKLAALGTAVQYTNGVLMTSTNGRNTLAIKDTGGYGFPAWDSVTGVIGRLSGQTDLPAAGYSNAVNYLLAGNGTNTVSSTAQLTFSTLTVDTAGGDKGIDLGTFTINPSGSGRGVLLSGGNTFSLAGTAGTLMSNSIFIHNYLSGAGAFNLSANLGTGQAVILGGSGFTNYTGSGFAGSGSTTSGLAVLGGIFRAAKDQDATVLISRVRVSDAIFEIGADLNGGAAGDFSNPVAIETNGSFAFYYNAGISAANGNRTVNFGGLGAELSWGLGGFLSAGYSSAAANSAGVDGGFALRLSSPRSDSTITLENPINLNANSVYGRRRTIEVANGSAGTDAILSGVISGGAGLVKSGAGTLLLSGANTYTGDTTVTGGKLLLGNAAAAGSGRVFINGSGTLGGSGAAAATTINGTLEVELNGATSSTLNVTGDLTIANGASIVVSVLSAPTLASYVIAQYTGTRTGTFTNVPAGYSVDYSQPNKVLLVVDGTPPVSAYTTWIAGFFTGVTDPLIVGPGADPDGDGLKNAVEFVLNNDPKSGVQGAKPVITKSGTNAIFTFVRRKDAALGGYASSVETSTSLLPLEWSPVGAGIVVVDNANPLLENVTVTIPIPGSAPKFFARLKVTY